MIQTENNKILDYMKAGASDRQIQEWLGLSQRNYEKRIKEMRESHLKDTLDQQAAEAKASLLQLSIQKIQALEMQANTIVTSKMVKDEVRLAAMDRVRQYAIDIAKLSIEGPTIFQIVPRDGLHIGDQRTANQLRDTQILSEPATTEDPNRVA